MSNLNSLLLGTFFLLVPFLVISQKNEPLPPLSDADKLFGLSKVWKEADRNFAYFDQVPDLDWEETYRSYIPKVLATKSNYEYYKVLQELVSQLQDGHTRVVVPWQLRQYLEVRPPMYSELIDDKVYVTEVYNDTLKQLGIRRGVEITAIDGMPVKEYATSKILPYVFYSTDQDRDIQQYRKQLLNGPIDQVIQMTIRDQEGEKTIAVSRKLSWDPQLVGKREIYEYQVLAGNIGHLKITRFYGDQVQEKFDSLYPMIQKADALILDVSVNDGGNSNYAHYVLSHFANKTFTTSRWKSEMYVPAYASWGQTTRSWVDNDGELVEPVEPEKRFTKPLVVLISERTYSAGEDFVSAFLTMDRGQTVGRPTAGTTGNPIGFGLPGSGGAQFCTKRDYLYNGKEFVGYGIQPEIFVSNSLEASHLVTKGLELLQADLD